MCVSRGNMPCEHCDRDCNTKFCCSTGKAKENLLIALEKDYDVEKRDCRESTGDFLDELTVLFNIREWGLPDIKYWYDPTPKNPTRNALHFLWGKEKDLAEKMLYRKPQMYYYNPPWKRTNLDPEMWLGRALQEYVYGLSRVDIIIVLGNTGSWKNHRIGEFLLSHFENHLMKNVQYHTFDRKFVPLPIDTRVIYMHSGDPNLTKRCEDFMREKIKINSQLEEDTIRWMLLNDIETGTEENPDDLIDRLPPYKRRRISTPGDYIPFPME